MNEPIKLIDREDEVVFTNWSDEDFEGKWNFSKNHKIYRLKAGKSYYLPFYLAEHFAKCLVDRELNKKQIPTDHYSRQELVDRCVKVQEPDSVNRMEVREAPVREVKLATQERNERYIEEGTVDPTDLKGGVGASAVAPAIASPAAIGRDEKADFTE